MVLQICRRPTECDDALVEMFDYNFQTDMISLFADRVEIRHFVARIQQVKTDSPPKRKANLAFVAHLVFCTSIKVISAMSVLKDHTRSTYTVGL